MKRLFVLSLLLVYFSAYSQDVKPTDNEALLNIKVTDFNKKPRKGDIIFFIGEKSGKTFKGISDAQGSFSLNVPKGDTYIIKYREYTSDQEYSKIEIPESKGKVVSDINIQLELPKTYILENVFFDTGKATLKPESNKALNDLYEVMKLKESLYIEISGHTDSIGGEELNKKLSEDRSNAVRSFLVKKGIASDRVIAKGYWFSVPLADNGTEEGRAKNRRTEVRIIKE